MSNTTIKTLDPKTLESYVRIGANGLEKYAASGACKLDYYSNLYRANPERREFCGECVHSYVECISYYLGSLDELKGIEYFGDDIDIFWSAFVLQAARFTAHGPAGRKFCAALLTVVNQDKLTELEMNRDFRRSDRFSGQACGLDMAHKAILCMVLDHPDEDWEQVLQADRDIIGTLIDRAERYEAVADLREAFASFEQTPVSVGASDDRNALVELLTQLVELPAESRELFGSNPVTLSVTVQI